MQLDELLDMTDLDDMTFKLHSNNSRQVALRINKYSTTLFQLAILQNSLEEIHERKMENVMTIRI